MENITLLNENLEERVKLKISVLGFGNAGNQTAARAHREGYRVFCINSSYKDLQDAVLNDSIPSFIIGNEARGAGKVRELAAKLLRENGKQLFTPDSIFNKIVEESDVIFVVSSTAGGTGSGISPAMIELIKKMYPNKIVIYYGILPKKSDSPTAQANCLNCVQEIRQLKIPYMMADLSYYENEANDVAYEKIQQHIIDSINVINGTYMVTSSSGMIDENDMRVTISEPGYMAAYMKRFTSAELEKESLQSQMVKIMKSSPAVDINRDKAVAQLAVAVSAPEEVLETSKTGNYDEINEFVGVPYGTFENYSTSNTSTGEMIVLYSGMNISHARLEEAKKKIEAKKKQEEMLAKKAEIDFSVDLQNRADISVLKSSASTHNSQSSEEKESILDSFFN